MRKAELWCRFEDAFDRVERDPGLCRVTFEVVVVLIPRCVLDGIEDDGNHSKVRQIMGVSWFQLLSLCLVRPCRWNEIVWLMLLIEMITILLGLMMPHVT